MKIQEAKTANNFSERLVALLIEQYHRSISENTKRGIAMAKENKTGRYAKNN